jgi:hypothetical protein
MNTGRYTDETAKNEHLAQIGNGIRSYPKVAGKSIGDQRVCFLPFPALTVIAFAGASC